MRSSFHKLNNLRTDYWRVRIAEQGCLYNLLLSVNGRLSDRCRKWALKALVHFANDRSYLAFISWSLAHSVKPIGNYRLRVGEGGLSSFIRTVIENPYEEVKVPAVNILAVLASNDSYRYYDSTQDL